LLFLIQRLLHISRRTIKKQYQKALKVIQAYALFAVGVKIILSNTTNGTRQIVLSTQQTSKLEENISMLFGSKFLSSLMPFSVELTDEDVLKTNVSGLVETENQVVVNSSSEPTDEVDSSSTGLAKFQHTVLPTEKDIEEVTEENVEGKPEFRVSIAGWISKVGSGVGRSDNDRQFIFCNKRPVDFPKMNRVLNEVWRKYEMKQKPAFIMDCNISKGFLDVNVTPDKREIIIRNESVLLDKLKVSIDDLYSPVKNTFVKSHPLITPYLMENVSSSFVTIPENSSVAIPIPTDPLTVASSEKNEASRAILLSSGSFIDANTIHANEVSHGDDQLTQIVTEKESRPVEPFSSSTPFSSNSSEQNHVNPVQRSVVWSTAADRKFLSNTTKLPKETKAMSSFFSFSSSGNRNKYPDSYQTKSEISGSTTARSFPYGAAEVGYSQQVEMKDSQMTCEVPSVEEETNEGFPTDVDVADAMKTEISREPVETSNERKWSFDTEEILAQYEELQKTRAATLQKKRPFADTPVDTVAVVNYEEKVESNLRSDTFKTIKKEVSYLVSAVVRRFQFFLIGL
jgi:DNA mismatch repair ATPase MutL